MRSAPSPVQEVASRSGSSEPAPAQPQLLFFYSPTSGFSRRIEGFVAQALQRRHNHHSFLLRRIDVEQHSALAEHFHVHRLPTLIVVADKRVQARIEMPRGAAEITRVLAPWLN